MFSELLHGVIGRTQQEAGVSEHDPTVKLQPCDLHIGIIPAGECLHSAVTDACTKGRRLWSVYSTNMSFRCMVKIVRGVLVYLPVFTLLHRLYRLCVFCDRGHK